MLQVHDMPDVNGTLTHQNDSVDDGDSPSTKRKRTESLSNHQEIPVHSRVQQQDKDHKSARFFSHSADVLQVLQRYVINVYLTPLQSLINYSSPTQYLAQQLKVRQPRYYSFHPRF